MTEGLFSAICVLKQKLKICPSSAIIETVPTFNLLTYLLSYMISWKNPSYFSQLFYAPCCLNTLFPFLASFLPWLIPFRPLSFVAQQKQFANWQISVQYRGPYRKKAEGHCGEETPFLERWDWNTSIWTTSGSEHSWCYKAAEWEKTEAEKDRASSSANWWEAKFQGHTLPQVKLI